MADTGDNLAPAIQIRALVRGCDHGSQACLAFGHGGKTDGGNVHTRIVQTARKFKCFCAFPHVYWSDRSLSRAGGKAVSFQAALEKFCIGPKFLEQFLAVRRIEEREGRLARGHDRGRMPGGKKKWARA